MKKVGKMLLVFVIAAFVGGAAHSYFWRPIYSCTIDCPRDYPTDEDRCQDCCDECCDSRYPRVPDLCKDECYQQC